MRNGNAATKIVLKLYIRFISMYTISFSFGEFNISIA